MKIDGDSLTEVENRVFLQAFATAAANQEDYWIPADPDPSLPPEVQKDQRIRYGVDALLSNSRRAEVCLNKAVSAVRYWRFASRNFESEIPPKP